MNAVFCWLLGVAAAGAQPGEVANPLLDGLVQQGVRMSDGSRVRLAKPTTVQRGDARAQAELLRRIATGGHPVSELVRKSIFAPFVLKVRPLGGSSEKPSGWRVDVWFVAYGNWEEINRRAFLESLATSAGESRRSNTLVVERLTPEAIENRHIPLVTVPGREDRYQRMSIQLFDRVDLETTWRAVVTRSPQAVVMAAAIDPRFDPDPEYANRWRPLIRDPENLVKLVPGEPRVYSHAAFYGKMTPLVEPVGAILVECRGVFEEPEAWFRGAPLLRSKLSMLVQEQVRAFRGRLARSGR